MNLALTHIVVVFVFILARLMPLAVLFPVVGGKTIPVRLRMALAVVISLMITPLYVTQSGLWEPTLGDLAIRLTRELLFGFGLALTVMILLGAFQAAGSLISQISGLAVADNADPNLTFGATPTERFFGLLSVAIFLSIGGHRQLVAAILETFHWIPPGKPAPPVDATTLLVELLTQSFELAIRIAGPVALSLTVATVVVGLIARSLPQVGAFGFGMGLNLAVLLTVLWLSFNSFSPLYEVYLTDGIDQVLQLFSEQRGGVLTKG